MLLCQNVDGAFYLSQDLQEPCWTGRHLNYFYSCTVPLILFYVIGFPAIGLFLITRAKKDNFRIYRYGILFYAYSEKRFYWMAIVTLRKAFMVFTISYVTSPFLEIHIVCLILGLSIAMDLIFQPYLGIEGVSYDVSNKLQLWDTSSMFVLMLTVWSSFFFWNYKTQCAQRYAWCVISYTCIFVINVAYICLMLYQSRDISCRKVAQGTV